MLTLLRVLLFLFMTGRKPEDDESEEFEGVDVLTASPGPEVAACLRGPLGTFELLISLGSRGDCRGVLEVVDDEGLGSTQEPLPRSVRDCFKFALLPTWVLGWGGRRETVMSDVMN
jgi:hypothetical protein